MVMMGLFGSAHVFLKDPEHLFPGHVVVADGVSVSALIALHRAGNCLANLADGHHGCAAFRIKRYAFHLLEGFHQEDPHRFAPGLGAEDVGQFQNGYIKVFIRE